MNRLLRVLLLALLIGPFLGPVLQPFGAMGAVETEDCCDRSSVCDDTCADCACCAASAVTLSSPVFAELSNGAPVLTLAHRSATPPAAPGSDILHVPKSG